MPAYPNHRETEIRMVEDIEELPVDAKLHALRQLKPLCQIEVAPSEVGTAEGVAAEIAELAVLRVVAAGAGACARIDRPKRMRPG